MCAKTFDLSAASANSCFAQFWYAFLNKAVAQSIS